MTPQRTIEQELLDLERAAWDALSTSGEAATKYYDHVLADDVLMLFPGGMVIDDRAQVVASMEHASWKSFELTDERVLPLGDSAAIVAYRATADRGDGDYTALFNSTYVREDGEWRLVLHQQTPD
jgi:uncharacterized protein YchJ